MMFRTLFVAAIVAFALVNTSAATESGSGSGSLELSSESSSPTTSPTPEPTSAASGSGSGAPTASSTAAVSTTADAGSGSGSAVVELPPTPAAPTKTPAASTTAAVSTEADAEPEPEPEPEVTTEPTPAPTTTTVETTTKNVTIAAVEYAFSADVGAKFAALSVAQLAIDNKNLGHQLMDVMKIEKAAYNEDLSGMQKNGAKIVGSRRRRADTYTFKVAIDTSTVSLADVNAAITTANSGTLPEITISVGGTTVTYQVPTIATAVQETVQVVVAVTTAAATTPSPATTTASDLTASATSVTVGWVTMLALALAQLL